MNPMTQLTRMMDANEPAYTYREGLELESWRDRAAEKLRELLGMDGFAAADVRVRVEQDLQKDGYRQIRLVMAAEESFDMNCYLLLPDGAARPPLMVCLQGHSTGVHISLGEPKFPGDEALIAGGRDFGVQAVRRGMAALCVEQRYMGERTEHPEEKGPECWIPALTELMLGRTAIGGRVWDVSRALDVVESRFPEVDTTRVGLMGHSGGGTVSLYAAALEPRVKAVMASGSLCSFRKSITVIRHCMCNHVPGILRWFEMGDLAGLLAPRPLIAVAGRDDEIFPLEGVRDAFHTVRNWYRAAGAPEACRLVAGDGGHRFYPDDAWPVFMELTGWKRE